MSRAGELPLRVAQGLVVLGLLAAWEVLPVLRIVDPVFVPPLHAVLEALGLPHHILDHPDNRIAYVDVGRILEECVARTSCQHFGFLVGRAKSIDSLGLLGEMVRHSPTIGRALRRLDWT